MVPESLPEVGLHRFGVVGVTFYQEVNGVNYVLRADGNVGVAILLKSE